MNSDVVVNGINIIRKWITTEIGKKNHIEIWSY